MVERTRGGTPETLWWGKFTPKTISNNAIFHFLKRLAITWFFHFLKQLKIALRWVHMAKLSFTSFASWKYVSTQLFTKHKSHKRKSCHEYPYFLAQFPPTQYITFNAISKIHHYTQFLLCNTMPTSYSLWTLFPITQFPL